MSVMYFRRIASRTDATEVLEVTPEERLSAGEGHQHGIEEPRRLSAPLGFVLALGRWRLPVIAEATPRVTAHGDLEMHQHGPACDA
jgi:hypothetical protein